MAIQWVGNLSTRGILPSAVVAGLFAGINYVSQKTDYEHWIYPPIQKISQGVSVTFTILGTVSSMCLPKPLGIQLADAITTQMEIVAPIYLVISKISRDWISQYFSYSWIGIFSLAMMSAYRSGLNRDLLR